MIQFDDATKPQILAADPESSSWVSANAGSGKTKVLTDRVARILLAGTHPGNILCLTFTKAAAANMQVRLFERLGKWSLLPDAELRETLMALGEDEKTITPKILRRARTLFAQALETPGGLKIQTIHAFSSAILRKFPREAGVSPQFEGIDERIAKTLKNEALESVAEEHAELFDEIAELAGSGLLDLVREIQSHRKLFNEVESEASVWEAFGLPENYAEQDLANELFTSPERNMFPSLLNAVENVPSPTNRKVQEFIGCANLNSPDSEDLSLAEKTFLTQKGEVKKTYATKPAIQKLSDNDKNLLENWVRKLKDLREIRLSSECARYSVKLLRFAKVFLATYESIKNREALLDFEDMILKVLSLLTRKESRDWIMYRLDGQIDHILVDEAQDVNPAQWDIVARLAEEFTAGSGARGHLERTIFAVGDEKQSIFGFQGARPEKFAQMHDHFKRAHAGAERKFQRQELQHSFRSASSILRLVDRVFETLEISEFDTRTVHKAFKTDLPGRVDLWPFTEDASEADESLWYSPERKAAPENSATKLAKAIAIFVSDSIENKTLLPSDAGARPIRPGDFLILVQTRSKLFHSIIRELKKKGLPIAGTDRLKIADELVANDLSGILAFLATPADDYSLACSLKSPLFGITESQLFSIAHNREDKSLWEILLERREEFSEAVEMLEDLLLRAKTAKPYELLEAILTEHEGRAKIISRMGTEIEEAIDVLLLQSLAYERTEPATLTGFLEWLAADEMDVKRELDQAGDEIRVMTVHGAKGLESPVVIVPQTGKRQIAVNDKVLITAEDVPVWKPTGGNHPENLESLIYTYAERERLERRRLLYVAMTRAENWLIVCGAGKQDDESWYHLVKEGMIGVGADTQQFKALEKFSDGDADGFRTSNGEWPEIEAKAPSSNSREAKKVELPEWTRAIAVAPEPAISPLPPSGLGGEKTVAADPSSPDAYAGSEGALRRGSFIHLLLEHLPGTDKCERRDPAKELSLRIEEELLHDEFEECLEACNLMLDNPELEFLFSGSALAEVSITAKPKSLGERSIYGFIDLLLVEQDRVLAVDFKSNAVVPKIADDVPEAILRQMGAYLESLETIYPERRVETAILWTKNGEFMPLGRDAVVSALARASDEFAKQEFTPVV